MSDINDRCPTCNRNVCDPYRRRVDGKTVEGCIDAAHDGHLYGSSLQWHNRREAKEFRKAIKATKKAKR